MTKRKNNRLRVGLYYTVMVLCGAAIGFISTEFFFMNGVQLFGNLFLSMAFRLALLVLAFMLHLFIHEGGHLVFGLLSGYGFVSFRIFNIMIINDHGHLLIRKFHLEGTAGQCLMSPPEPENGHIPCLLYNMGGVIMNLITCFAAMILIWCTHGHPFLKEWLFQFVLFGVVIALINGIPFGGSTVSNDGSNTIALESNPKANRAFYLQMKINAMMSQGVSLLGMPEEWFEVPDDEDMDNPLIATLGVYACNRMMEQHRFTDMEALIVHFRSIENAITDIHMQLLMCDLLTVRLLSGKSGDAVDSILTSPVKKVMKTMKDYPAVIRTQYALALLYERDEKKADEYRHRLAVIAPDYPYHTDILNEKDIMIIITDMYRRISAKEAEIQ